MLRFLKRKRPSSSDDDSQPPAKRRRLDPSTSFSHPFNSSTHVKIITWNLNGMMSVTNRNLLKPLIAAERPTVLCLQETKLTPSREFDFKHYLLDYEGFFSSSRAKAGYSGVATYFHRNASDVGPALKLRSKLSFSSSDSTTLDQEGRVQFFVLGPRESPASQLLLANTYVPNSGMNLLRLGERVNVWDSALHKRLRSLRRRFPLLLWTGDLNVTSLLPKDIHQSPTPSFISSTPCCTPAERTSFQSFLTTPYSASSLSGISSPPFCDLFEHFHSDLLGRDRFTHYSYRGNRESLVREAKGWRLDYFVGCRSLIPFVEDCYVLKDYWRGSDHLPVAIILKKWWGETSETRVEEEEEEEGENV